MPKWVQLELSRSPEAVCPPWQLLLHFCRQCGTLDLNGHQICWPFAAVAAAAAAAAAHGPVAQQAQWILGCSFLQPSLAQTS